MNVGPEQFSPYRILLEKVKTPELRALATSLLKTSNGFHRLQNEFAKSIGENRAKRRRKVTRVGYPKRQKEFLAEADKDAMKASEHLEKVYRSIGDENELVKTALRDEKFDFETWTWLYDSVHDDDKPMANRIRKLQRKLIDDMEEFIVKTR